MTDLRPYFTQIIGHNSVNVHRIPTKVGTEIRLNEPFKCAKFQPDPSEIFFGHTLDLEKIFTKYFFPDNVVYVSWILTC